MKPTGHIDHSHGLDGGVRLHPLVIDFFGLAGGAPYSLALNRLFPAEFRLVDPGRLGTSFSIGTGPLGQELSLRSFELRPQSIVFALDVDHELVELRVLVATASPYVRGRVQIARDAHVRLWTMADELTVLGSGNWSLFLS